MKITFDRRLFSNSNVPFETLVQFLTLKNWLCPKTTYFTLLIALYLVPFEFLVDRFCESQKSL